MRAAVKMQRAQTLLFAFCHENRRIEKVSACDRCTESQAEGYGVRRHDAALLRCKALPGYRTSKRFARDPEGSAFHALGCAPGA